MDLINCLLDLIEIFTTECSVGRSCSASPVMRRGHKLNEPKLVSVCTQCSGVLTTQAYTQAAHTHHNQSRRDTHGTSTLHGEDTGRPPTFAPQVSEEQLLVLSFCSVSGSEWHSECCVRSSGALTDVIAKIDQPRQGRCAADLLRRAGSTLRRYSGRCFFFFCSGLDVLGKLVDVLEFP